MPPIPIYTKSPINAAKADGVTPQTAAPSDEKAQHEAPTTTTAQAQGGYPAAQPGAVPSLPSVTQPATNQYTPLQPTPTTSVSAQGPPPPQPGARPAAPGATATRTTAPAGPPPPTVTAPARLPDEGPAPPAPVPYPGQMAVPAPATPYAQRGTSTATPSVQVHQQTVLTHQLSHPPGYQQNVDAADMPSGQAAPQYSPAAGQYGGDQGLGGYGGRGLARGGEEEEEGVWGAARKWAQAAGDKLSAAEQEVWKKINGKE